MWKTHLTGKNSLDFLWQLFGAGWHRLRLINSLFLKTDISSKLFCYYQFTVFLLNVQMFKSDTFRNLETTPFHCIPFTVLETMYKKCKYMYTRKYLLVIINSFITHAYRAICFLIVLTWSSERCHGINCPLHLRPHSHWLCLGVFGWGWGGWRGRQLKGGRSAATRSSGQAGRGCIGRSHSTEWRTCVSSELNGTGRGGTVDTREVIHME